MTDLSADISRIYTAIDGIRETQSSISVKLAQIETTLTHQSDIRGRVEALEKDGARRAGYFAAVATAAGSVAGLVMSMLGGFLKAKGILPG